MTISNMTLIDIKNDADSRVGVAIDFNDVRDWCNECQRMYINPVARVEALESIPTIPGVREYDLPSDILEYNIQLVKLNNKMIYPVGIYKDILNEYEYQLWNDKIKICSPRTAGVLDIYYFKMMPDLENPEDEPGIPNQYRQLYVNYVCMKYQQQDEELELEADYGSNFYTMLNLFTEERGKRANKTRKREWEVKRR